MKDKEDIMVKDLIKYLKIDTTLAIQIMFQIRGNKDRYFRIMDSENGK